MSQTIPLEISNPLYIELARLMNEDDKTEGQIIRDLLGAEIRKRRKQSKARADKVQ